MERDVQAGRLVSSRYRLLDKLGSGGFGQVWKAHDEKLQVDVALKELRLPPLATDADRTEWTVRANREARKAAALRDHPHIVAVHDVVVEDGISWTVMQLIVGHSLQDHLHTRGALSVTEAGHIATAVLKALGAAHDAGIVHRDVKPANVMIADSGQVLLTDFGIAVHPNETALTSPGALVGSLDYIAPERIKGQDGQPAGDLFSLGVTLYRAIEGVSPFNRENTQTTLAAVLAYDPPPAQRAGRLAPLITRLLEKDPDRRPTIAEALALISRPFPAPAPPAPAPSPSVPRAPVSPVYEPTEIVGAPAQVTAVAPPPGPHAGVSLSRGQTIKLVRPDGRALTTVRIGFRWQATPQSWPYGNHTPTIDLDALALLFADRQPCDLVFFRHQTSDDGSVRHTGDSLVNSPEGTDHEAILVDLSRVPRHINQIIFILNSFIGQTFEAVQSTFCRVIDETVGHELVHFAVTDHMGQHTGQIVAKVNRDSDSWRMTTIGAPAHGRNIQELMPAILPHL
ncbi:TerD family protein [Streptomyces sp. NBC_01635]|uniref:protein kinase domain-containing protein n=1 Tax=Streptomyces sp. NBC_01635 TaxID=2975904 RepID=UPI00386F5795|nr:TerD family protein [Streptomyces sp. NBC_01635]